MQPSPQTGYVVDPDDPRAPPQEIWDAMSPAERKRLLDSLPSDMPYELHPPEGDTHREAKESTQDALRRFFRTTGRKVYVGAELVTYYPGERRFSPDILAVMDISDHARESFNVAAEGRGLDFVLEVHVKGDAKKDFELNVERYARLGITEYFVLDLRRGRLLGHRLAGGTKTYQPLVPQHGRWTSIVLGLDLAFEGDMVRFYSGSAPLPLTAELLGRVQTMLDDVVTRRQEAEARLEEETRLREEETRLREEERRLRLEAERRIAELEAELARLRGAPKSGEHR